MKNKDTLIIIGLIILMGIAGGFCGYGLAQVEVATQRTEIQRLEYEVEELRFWIDVRDTALEAKPIIKEVEVEVIKEVPVEVIKEVPIEVEKIAYVDRIVTENVTPEYKDFETEQELTAFLEADTTDEIPNYWSIGDTTIRLWCYDYAEILRDNLHEAGYHANIQCEELGKLPMSDRILKGAHAMVSVRVADEQWLIDVLYQQEDGTWIHDEHWKAWNIRLMEVN